MGVTCKVPELRFGEFKDNLEAVKLKDIISANTYGPRFNANDYHQNGNVKTIRGTDISLDGTIKYEQVPLAKLDTNFIKNHILKNGDLVMITTADCGLTGIFEKQEIDYIPSAYAVKIKLNVFNEPYYFKYFFQTHLAKKEINKYIRKATVANLPASDILRIKFNLPTKQEQEKIASFLSSVDSRIEQLTKKEKLLGEYKKGVMQKIFSQELRFHPKGISSQAQGSDDDGSEFPEWVEKKLGEVSIVTMGQSPDSNSYNLDNEGIPLIQGNADIKDRKTNPRQWTNKPTKLCKIGSIILTVRAPVGAIAKCFHNACIGRGICSIQNNKFSNINFLYQFLLDFEKRWINLEQGSTFTAVSASDIRSLKINLPSIKEQTKIANFLSSLDTKIEQVSKELKLTKEFKKALLQQMFV